MPTTNPEILNITVRRIKLLMLTINERVAIKTPTFSTNFTQSTQFNLERNILILNLSVAFIVSEEEKDSHFFDAVIQNVFEIPDLKKYITKENKVFFPIDILTTLVALSISHARAIIATNSAGTPLQDMMIPLVDPLTVTTALFPDNFEEQYPSAVSIPEQSL